MLTPVSRFAELPPRARPPAYCPSCLERVTLKLGRVLRAHFAHRPRSACPAGRGEDALHLAAKLHLAAALGASAGCRISFQRLCAGVDGEHRTPCARSAPSVLQVAWTEVAVEVGSSRVRADVALLRRGEVVAGLEVRSTHAVASATAAAYAAQALPWLEISTTSLLPEAGPAWSTDRPVETLSDAASFPDGWRCPVCAPRQAAVEVLRREGASPFAWRRVHLYLRDAGVSGGEIRVQRFDVAAVEQRRDGAAVQLWLERSDTGRRLAGPAPLENPEQALGEAHRLFRLWAARAGRERGGVVESPGHWSSSRPRGEHPARLRWDGHAEAFRGAPNLPPVAWPTRPGLSTGWTEPHPVLGYARCAWAEAHPRRGVRTHAIAGAWWLTLEEHVWREGAETLTRADVSAWRYSRCAWRPVGQVSHTGPRRDWAVELPALSEAVIAADPVDRAGVDRVLAAYSGD
jgi:hypothetical protein